MNVNSPKRALWVIAALVAVTGLLAGTAVAASAQQRHRASRAGATVSANGARVSGTASPGTVAPDGSVALRASVSSTVSRRVVVDIEVYDASGQRVDQAYWENQDLVAGKTHTFEAAWTAPASAGRYRVAVGVFSADWASLLVWNNQAATLTIAATPSTPSTPSTAAPTTTAAAGGTGSSGTPTTVPSDPSTTATTAVPPTVDTTTSTSGSVTTVPPTTTPPTTAPPTTARVTTTPPSGSGGPTHFATSSVGAALPSGAQCAAWVGAVPAPPEVKGINTTANATRGSAMAGATGRNARVDGNFTGTTEQIIRWAACKWGIDEDMVKAQAVIESWWRMDTKGDLGSDPTRCPPGHGLGVDGTGGQCPESWGLLQIRYPYNVPAFPMAMTSTAFNADYAYAQWRNCYEGELTWLNTVERGTDYAAGDAWGCFGTWFSGRWHTAAGDGYVARVQSTLADRTWTTPNFKQP